ncbi:MAG TPA: cytochrome c oxidase subunit II [Acidimicrobiia bacterium]|nr:cytochrome c oxidase subunit II [Acidimicrobiia bacterium]
MTLFSTGSFDPQGPVAETMADLWWFMLVLGTAVFILVMALLIWGLSRRRPPTDERPSNESPRSYDWWVLGGGVVLPVVILIVVFGATVLAMTDTPEEIPANALVIELVGHQWWWEVHYPDAGFTTANEMHLPVGRPIAIEMTSADVIHSFWAPALGGKLDLLPDGTNTLVLQADEAGVHNTACAEFCGLQHAEMGLTVVAEPPEEFAVWVAGQMEPAAQPADESAARGEEIFLSSRCVECHTVRGTPAAGDAAPDLTHFASRRRLGAGAAPNNSAELAQWVADPHTIKEGVDMPASQLNDEELAAVVAYLKGLK